MKDCWVWVKILPVVRIEPGMAEGMLKRYLCAMPSPNIDNLFSNNPVCCASFKGTWTKPIGFAQIFQFKWGNFFLKIFILFRGTSATCSQRQLKHCVVTIHTIKMRKFEYMIIILVYLERDFAWKILCWQWISNPQSSDLRHLAWLWPIRDTSFPIPHSHSTLCIDDMAWPGIFFVHSTCYCNRVGSIYFL